MTKVIVCQDGSRHRYAIPHLLHDAGRLSALYTTSCAYSPLGRFAALAAKVFPLGPIRRLANRKVDLPMHLVSASDILLFWTLFHKKRNPREWGERKHRVLSRRMIKWGLRDCDVVFSMYSECYDFIRYAKAHGKRVVVDVFITPLSDYLIADFEWLSGDRKTERPASEDYPHLKECLDVADLISCPSTFVRDSILALWPDLKEDRIVICPYGSSIDYDGAVNKPTRGRFFWAGGDWKRKGLPALAAAADILLKKYPDMEFRAAGVTDCQVVSMPCFRNIHFLGKLDAAAMKEEFLNADAFVLPTISEGMASVCVEALAAGCPIVVPPSAGIDPVDGVFGGLSLRDCTANSVVIALEKLYCDREARAGLSTNALRQAKCYSMAAWQERLAALVDSFSHESAGCRF